MVNQPSINRGTLIILSPDATEPTISAKNFYFTFQYNPEKIHHTFNPSIQPATSRETDSQYPPTEFFNITFELDSIEIEAATKKQIAPDFGLHPALAMLEMMMQPQIKDKQTSMPILIFKWGQKRLVPVYLVSMGVEEKTFDQTLNPTRANVNIVLRALTATEVKLNQAAQKAYDAHKYDGTTLVDVYKLQTDQASVSTKPSTGAQAAAASGKSIGSKTKVNA